MNRSLTVSGKRHEASGVFSERAEIPAMEKCRDAGVIGVVHFTAKIRRGNPHRNTANTTNVISSITTACFIPARTDASPICPAISPEKNACIRQMW